MPGPGRYRQRAEECVELAKTVRDQNERRILLNIAEQYRRLANRKEKQRPPPPRQQPIAKN
jgi:hypothetical protein